MRTILCPAYCRGRGCRLGRAVGGLAAWDRISGARTPLGRIHGNWGGQRRFSFLDRPREIRTSAWRSLLARKAIRIRAVPTSGALLPRRTGVLAAGPRASCDLPWISWFSPLFYTGI